MHPSFGLNGEPGHIVYDYPEGFNLTNATEASSASAGSSSQAAESSTAATGASSSTSSVSYLATKPTPGVRNINYPPYVINHVQDQGDLAVHAASPNATHHNGIQEYDVHNLYGHQILQATYGALAATMPGKRPFIIGRSTFQAVETTPDTGGEIMLRSGTTCTSPFHRLCLLACSAFPCLESTHVARGNQSAKPSSAFSLQGKADHSMSWRGRG